MTKRTWLLQIGDYAFHLTRALSVRSTAALRLGPMVAAAMVVDPFLHCAISLHGRRAYERR